MDWMDINGAPEDRPIAILAQSADESLQRIIPNCMFRLDLGGSYAELHEPEEVVQLSLQGEWATHWAEPIDIPKPTPL